MREIFISASLHIHIRTKFPPCFCPLFPSFSALFSLSRFFIFFHSKHLLSQIPTHSSSPFPPIPFIFSFPLNSLQLFTTQELIASLLFLTKPSNPRAPDSTRLGSIDLEPGSRCRVCKLRTGRRSHRRVRSCSSR